MNTVKLSIPSHLHKYIIGTKGSTISQIVAQSGDSKLRITCSTPDNTVTIESTVATALASARKQVEQIHDQHKSKIDTNSLTEKLTVPLPANLQKYVIGDAGATIKNIQASTMTQIAFDSPKNTANIQASSKANAQKAHQLMLNALKNFGWHFEESSKSFVEKNMTDILFEKYRKKVVQEHDLMSKCYEDAQKAFKDNRKDEAKKLSEQGKKHQENRDKYQKEAAKQILDEMNKGKSEDEIDLHGLLVQEAIDFVNERLTKLMQSKKFKTFHIITGAGNHSEVSAKIKPEIGKLLDSKKLKYVRGNDGVFVVTL